MNSKHILKDMTNILRTLHDAGLLYTYLNPVSESHGHNTVVTWPNHVSGATYNAEGMFGLIEQYKGILSKDAYLAVLRDGAIIKAAYFFDRYNSLVQHNLWYWPNPFEISETDINEYTPLDVLDLYATDWEKHIRFRTPLRFDYAPEVSEHDHPAVHLHMQSEECRLGVQEPICFGNFVNFIYRNFYPQEWKMHDFWDDLPRNFQNMGNCLSNEQMLIQHIRWNKQCIANV